ncbi:MAG TPA: hypothetical protein VM890_13495 [Longimicrobium sp.]|jgi:hypothetical protein|nr:hypothetical protein [Longimicrobium sp.]
MRNLPVLTLLCFALAAAPTHAQRSSNTALREHVGTSVGYRVGIPERWELKEEGEELTATNGRVTLFLGVRDLVTEKRESRLPVSPAESRRIMTNFFMGSDSLLLGLMDRMRVEMMEERGVHCTQLTREVRELAGQHAGFLSLRCDRGRRESVRFDSWLTVKDGVAYLLMYLGEPKDHAANEPLFDRVRQSLVLADTPPAGAAQ